MFNVWIDQSKEICFGFNNDIIGFTLGGFNWMVLFSKESTSRGYLYVSGRKRIFPWKPETIKSIHTVFSLQYPFLRGSAHKDLQTILWIYICDIPMAEFPVAAHSLIHFCKIHKEELASVQNGGFVLVCFGHCFDLHCCWTNAFGGHI
jgi:hypothetical protein